MISGVFHSFSALVGILCHFLKEQIMDSAQTGWSACRAKPVHEKIVLLLYYLYCIVLYYLYCCIIWFVLSTELGTADQKGRGWGEQRQREPS